MSSNRDKEHIVRLLKGFANSASTDEMLYLIAETSGMLNACTTLIQTYMANDREIVDWVHAKCKESKVDRLKFIAAIQYVLSLFKPSQSSDSSLYRLLDLQPGASRDAIKQSYRQLCRRYHPDTASGKKELNAETFINITKAYHTLLTRKIEEAQMPLSNMGQPWRRLSATEKSTEPERKKIWWLSILIIMFVLVGISLIASRMYNAHIMINSLRHNGTAFVPPAKKIANEDAQPDRRMPPLRERSENDLSLQTPALPLPPVEITPVLLAGSANLVSTGVVVASSTASSPEASPLPSLATSAVEKDNRQWKEASVAAAPASNKNAEQKDLNKKGVQLTHSADLQQSTTKKATDSTDKLRVKTQNKEVVDQQPKASFKDNLETGKKGQQAKLTPKSNDRINTVQAVQDKQPPPPTPAVELQTQQRIEIFLKDYITAYQQRNLSTFQRFFSDSATENGKPLKDILPVYTQLFESTDSLRFSISVLNWQQDKTMIQLHGRFTIALVYRDGKKIKGKGGIHFQIAETPDKLQIKTLTYAFDE